MLFLNWFGKLIRSFPKTRTPALAEKCLNILKELLDVLGLWREEEKIPQEILELANKRTEARAQKNWALADEIRETLRQKGYEIKDSVDGVKINRI